MHSSEDPPVADLAADRPEHHPAPLEPGTPLSATLLHQRLDRIKDMCATGQPIYPIIVELRYLADVLDEADRLTWMHR